MKILKQGDYILITDQYDSNFLKIGEIVDIDYYPGGGIKEYTVLFGYSYETSSEELDWFDYNLSDKCRVLQFENR